MRVLVGRQLQRCAPLAQLDSVAHPMHSKRRRGAQLAQSADILGLSREELTEVFVSSSLFQKFPLLLFLSARAHCKLVPVLLQATVHHCCAICGAQAGCFLIGWAAIGSGHL